MAAQTAGNVRFAFVVFGNRAATPCQFSRLPQIQLLDDQGNVLPIVVTPGDPCPAQPTCPFPSALAPGLTAPIGGSTAPKGQAVLTLNWSIGTAAGACSNPSKGTGLKLLFDEGASPLVVDLKPALPEGIVPCSNVVYVADFSAGRD